MSSSSTGTPNSVRDTGTNDRRITPRRNVVDSHLVTVDLAFQSGALLLDLSDVGMGVQALSSAPIGTTTTLQFDLPETGGRVDAVGRVTWTDSSGRLGIRFEEIAELSRVHLAQWLARDRRPAVASSAPKAAMPAWPPLYARDEIAALRRDLTTERLEGDAALSFVVERIRNVTRATGAAIALEDGGAIVCRATSGNAPGVGARLDPNSGLSGECIRTGEIVRCEDTETDPRADRLVCRKLELRSIVIVPIRIQGRPAGVLEAFSSRAHAFQSSDVLLLRRVSDLVAGIAIRQPDATAPLIAGPQGLMAATTVPLIPEVPEPVVEEESTLRMEDIFASAEQVVVDVAEEEIAPLPAPPVTTKPEARPEPVRSENVAPPVMEKAAEIPKAEEPASISKHDVVAAEATPAPAHPAVTAPVERPATRPAPVERAAISPAPPAPAPKVVMDRPAPPPPLVERHAAPATVTTRVQPPAPPPPAPPATMRAMGTAAAASAPAPARPRPLPVDLEYHRQADAEEATPMDDELLASMAPTLAKPWRLRIARAAILLAVLGVGGWQVWRAVAPPKGTPMDSEMKQAKPVTNEPASAVTSSATSNVPSVIPASLPSTVPVTAQPGVKPSATAAKPANPPAANPPAVNPPAAAKNPPAQTVVKAASATSDVPREVAKAEIPEAPSAMGLGVRPSGSAAISNLLAAPVAPPTLDRPVVSEMTGGKLIRRFDPVYPSAAAGLRGEVVLKATISKQGEVSKITVVKGQALLAQAAVAAVRRWKYEPFRLNGVPIEIENTIVVNFKAPGQ